MKKKVLLALCNLLLQASTFCHSQTFQRTFGNSGSQVATCIKSTQDGNYIICGISPDFSNGYEDAFLLKMDTGGNMLWTKAYGGTYKDRAYYVSSCSDGGFIVTGYTSLFVTGSNTDVSLIRTDSDGNLSWSRSVGGSQDDLGWYVTEANDGGFMAAGSSKSFNTSYDGYVVKTDAAGNLQWTRVIGGSNAENFHGMNKTSDGGYILTGITSTNTFGSSDIWLVKLNSAGDTLWTRQYGKATEDAGNAVIQTTDGGYMIAGDIHTNPAAGNHNSCLLKTDALGNMQWVKTYGSNPGTEIAWDLRQTTDGGYLLFGSSAFYGNGGGGDMLTIKTDNSGNLQWAKAYGSTAFDDFWYSQRTPDDGTLLVGTTSGGGQKVYVIKTDALGNSTCGTTTVVPDVNTPVLQVRSGTTVISAGTPGTPNTVTFPATMISDDPCALVSVVEGENSIQLMSIYPNPFTKSATIDIANPITQDLELRVYNLLGSCIHKQSINTPRSALEINANAGIYFYKLLSPQGTIATGKIILK